jgi:arginine repressor
MRTNIALFRWSSDDLILLIEQIANAEVVIAQCALNRDLKLIHLVHIDIPTIAHQHTANQLTLQNREQRHRPTSALRG